MMSPTTTNPVAMPTRTRGTKGGLVMGCGPRAATLARFSGSLAIGLLSKATLWFLCLAIWIVVMSVVGFRAITKGREALPLPNYASFGAFAFSFVRLPQRMFSSPSRQSPFWGLSSSHVWSFRVWWSLAAPFGATSVLWPAVTLRQAAVG